MGGWQILFEVYRSASYFFKADLLSVTALPELEQIRRWFNVYKYRWLPACSRLVNY